MTIGQAELNAVLRYEPTTGKLYWRERGIEYWAGKSQPERVCKAFSTRFAGKEAFTYVCQDGYRIGQLPNGKLGKAHRVIWCMVTGVWPEFIDHINGTRDDNRWSNLRSASRSDNMRNMKTYSTNLHGVAGVCWNKKSKKWVARIGVDKKLIQLGFYTEFNDALAIRKAAERQYGFHENHGRT